MINSIFDILNQLGKIAGDTTLLKVYKDQKPSTETGDCIVISNMPIKKTNKISPQDRIYKSKSSNLLGYGIQFSKIIRLLLILLKISPIILLMPSA